MPICTTCTHWTPYLYTVYQSAYNMRLEQCNNCHAFADPYVEHDTLTLLIDLILLKRGVYRHLLYNRGAKPKRASEKGEQKEKGIKPARDNSDTSKWPLVIRLGLTLVFVDAFIRWSYLNAEADLPPKISPWSLEMIGTFGRTFLGCLAETVSFHSGILTSCYALQRIIEVIKGPQAPSSVSDVRREFRYSLIPLSLFYSSLTKLFLLFLLTIWRPSRSASPPTNATDWQTLDRVLGLLTFFDDDKLDREWIIRNVLGGMSAGFGLRVILDSHPFFTTIIILAGWACKTAMASIISGWVGGNRQAEVWMAYSIP